jgi:chemotaxis protein methyltransferase CheR
MRSGHDVGVMMAARPAPGGPSEVRGLSSELDDENYEFLRRLIYSESRIHLGSDKRALVASRLAKRLRELRIGSFDAYCALLRSNEGVEERRHLVDRISTNHTQFFREMKHFDFIRERVIPAWHARKGGASGVLRVWSAACSSGEEPYSLAIFLAEHLAPAARTAWQIEATDISTRILEKASTGIYPADRVTGMRHDWLQRHFQKGVGEWSGSFRVKDSLRDRVRFHHLNLLEPNYPFQQPFQLILCRNVMIYFDRTTQESLVSYLSRWLEPGGFLMVGHSESLSGIHHGLKLVQPAIYQKPAP